MRTTWIGLLMMLLSTSRSYAVGERAVAYGEVPVSGLVSERAKPDRYVVRATARDRLRLSAFRLVGAFNICVKVSLLDNGSFPSSDCDNRGTALLSNYLVAATGTYLIEVSLNQNAAAALEYQLLVGCDGDCPAPPADYAHAVVTAPVTLSQNVVAQGSVSVGDPRRVYSFQAAAPNTYKVEITEVPSSNAICFTVYNPTGWLTEVSQCTGTAIAVHTVSESFVPARAGLHTVQVSARSSGNMSYSLKLTCTGASCATPSAISTVRVDPQSLAFSAPSGAAARLQGFMTVTSALSQQKFEASVPGANWLTVEPATGLLPEVIRITVDPTKVSGVAEASISLRLGTGEIRIPVKLSVTSRGVFQFQVDSPPLQIPARRSGYQNSRNVTVRNVSGQAGVVRVSPRGDAPWLSVNPSEIPLAGGQASQVIVSVDVDQIPPSDSTQTNKREPAAAGQSGTLVFSDGVTEKELPVVVSISGDLVPVPILVPETLSLFTQLGDSSVDQAEIYIGNGGSSPVDWKATRSDTALSVAPEQRLSLLPGAPLEAVQVSLTENVRRFETAGSRKAAVNLRFGNPGAEFVVDIPIQVEVISGRLPIQVRPAGIIASYSDDLGKNLSATQIRLLNRTGLIRTVTVTSNAGWLKVANGAVRIPAAVTKDGNRVSSEANISIDLSTSQLPPDGTRATITVAEEGSRLQTVEVLYWTPSVRQAKPQSAHAAESTACENSTLQTVLTSHGQGFELRTDVPSTFEALVIDSCGKPLTSGAVRIFFPSEKASISLEHVVGGRWLGSWTPSLSVERINGEIQAVSADGAASSRVPIYGTVIGPTR